MLVELRVSGFATIDQLEVKFLRPGLNVLTGETGAGKSVLIKSLSLLFGGKTGPDVIRANHENAIIEGAFDLGFRPDIEAQLNDLGLPGEDKCLIVRRIISRTGKNRVFINGHMATLNTLEMVLPKLVEITGQHEHQTLFNLHNQLQFLDLFGGYLNEAKTISETFEKLKTLKREHEELSQKAQERQQRIDFLSFQVDEIQKFNPQIGDDTELEAKLKRSKNSSKLAMFYNKAEEAVYSGDGSLHSQIVDLKQEAQTLADLEANLIPTLETLSSVAAQLDEIAHDLRKSLKDGFEIDSEEQEFLEDRYSQLKKLQKKYGASVEEIISFQKKAQDELDLLQKMDESIASIETEMTKTQKILNELSQKLHQKRVKSAKELEKRINSELSQLKMTGVDFLIQVRESSEVTSSGVSVVEFMFNSTIQDTPKPISKIASGGELSRVMLALKQAISKSEMPMTYLFDEVDSGVSGPTAEKVGLKLKTLGKNHQVISITHLPQVASFADAHFEISKGKNKQGQIFSKVTELNREDRIKELSRLISGEKITKTSLAHAKKLLEEHC